MNKLIIIIGAITGPQLFIIIVTNVIIILINIKLISAQCPEKINLFN